MKFSTRTRYGTRVLWELALHWGEGPLHLKDIAQRQQIPLPYLQHLIRPLVQKGIINTARGTRGGISLTKHPRKIMLNDAIQLLEGSFAPVQCVDNPEVCLLSGHCVTRSVWREIRAAVTSALGSMTLQDLAERGRRRHLPR